MIYLCVKGGLGNQLFQIFTAIAYALQEHDNFSFFYYKNIGYRETYWDNFLIHLKKYTNIVQLFGNKKKVDINNIKLMAEDLISSDNEEKKSKKSDSSNSLVDFDVVCNGSQKQ